MLRCVDDRLAVGDELRQAVDVALGKAALPEHRLALGGGELPEPSVREILGQILLPGHSLGLGHGLQHVGRGVQLLVVQGIAERLADCPDHLLVTLRLVGAARLQGAAILFHDRALDDLQLLVAVLSGRFHDVTGHHLVADALPGVLARPDLRRAGQRVQVLVGKRHKTLEHVNRRPVDHV